MRVLQKWVGLALVLFTSIGVAAASAATFTLVADSTTAAPGGSGTFGGGSGIAANFGAPAFDSGGVAFRHVLGANGRAGIYSYVGGSLTVVADSNTSIPGGVGTFGGRFGDSATFGDPDLEGGSVAFRAVAGANDFTGIYTNLGGSLHSVVDSNTAVPGGSGAFGGPYGDTATFGDPSLDGGRVAFLGTQGNVTRTGIYSNLGGALAAVADSSTPIPGGTGTFGGPFSDADPFGNAALGGSDVAFRAVAGANDFTAIYSYVGGSLSVVADSNSAIPGGAGTFGGPFGDGATFGDPALDGGNVAFRGVAGASDFSGIYTYNGGALHAVADSNTPIPDGTGTFGGQFGTSAEFSDPSISGNNVAFIARDSGESEGGLFVSYEGVLLRVLGIGDLLDGKTVRSLGFGRSGLDGIRLAFQVEFTNDTQGIYIATIPEPSSAVLIGVGLGALARLRRRAFATNFPKRAPTARGGASPRAGKRA